MREILFRGKRLDNGEWNNQYVLKCTTNGVSDNIFNVIESPEDVEVFRNIYDNPELIKDGK